MPTATNHEQERLELAALLGSGIFSRAPSLAQLLSYVCDKYFEGEAGQIKEYNIAIEALRRPADFDQKKDSIVRVEAHRLRKRLKAYYETEGSSHAIRIEIPSGQYAPRFIPAEPPAPLPLHSAITIDRPVVAIPEPAPRPRSAYLFTSAALLAAGLLTFAISRTSHPSAISAAGFTAPALAQVSLQAPGDTIRILAGSRRPYTDRSGDSWQTDRYFTGGTANSSPHQAISGTCDPALYQSRREGAFQYDIPLQPGSHELRLYFAEVIFGEPNSGGGETSRLFNVSANGVNLLREIDVVADGGPNVAHIRVFKDIKPAADGYLHLRFDPVINVAFLNAIEVAPSLPGKMRPIRIVARNQPFIDNAGQFWGRDRFFRGGQQVLRTNHIAGTFDQELYRGERFGNINYAIPVAPGRYRLVLHFAETWFGFGKQPKGGSESRLFDILCNGVALARSFDIYKEAGGGDRAIQRVYQGLEPSPQGTLLISLVPVKNYACINALEVIDESGSE